MIHRAPLWEADPPSPPGGGGPPVPRVRPASVVLREEDQSQAELMDPANRSLADALRITFRLLQIAMIVLVGLFAFSGVQTVNEGESGLRLVFGRLVEDDVAPGMRFALPAPVGEIVRVPTGNKVVEDATAFYPFVSAELRAQGPDRLPYMHRLNPARDGSILTGDQALAHAIVRVQYRRTDPASYARNVLDATTEEMLVLNAVRQGMVRACAEISIDNFLREQQAGSIARRAQEVAQRTLDTAGAGITLEGINLVQRIPPSYLRASFNKVQNAQAEAGQKLDEARMTANATLNSMAGLAARDLIELIEEYDRAMEQRVVLSAGGEVDPADLLDADEILALIDAMLEGRSVTFRGVTTENRTSGEATAILQRAAVERARLVNNRQARLQMFLAKQEQYRQNESVMLTSEWSRAMATLLGRDFTQKYMLPTVSAFRQLYINQDPRIIRDLDAARKAEDARAAAERSLDEFLNRPFSTPTGVFARPD